MNMHVEVHDGRLVLIEEDPTLPGNLNSDPAHAYWTVGYSCDEWLYDCDATLQCWSNTAPTISGYMWACPKNWVLV